MMLRHEQLQNAQRRARTHAWGWRMLALPDSERLSIAALMDQALGCSWVAAGRKIVSVTAIFHQVIPRRRASPFHLLT